LIDRDTAFCLLKDEVASGHLGWQLPCPTHGRQMPDSSLMAIRKKKTSSFGRMTHEVYFAPIAQLPIPHFAALAMTGQKVTGLTACTLATTTSTVGCPISPHMA
jgi:hypothetical protein